MSGGMPNCGIIISVAVRMPHCGIVIQYPWRYVRQTVKFGFLSVTDCLIVEVDNLDRTDVRLGILRIRVGRFIQLCIPIIGVRTIFWL